MVRAVLVATVAAAILVPWALWDPPLPAPTAEVAFELPDRVLAASHVVQLPFGCPETRSRSCCKGGGREVALLVDAQALWLGTNDRLASPLRIPRDGREWSELAPVLHTLKIDMEWAALQIAVHDEARYDDLLTAMVVARSAGYSPRVIPPALPSYPNHGYGGGMAF